MKIRIRYFQFGNNTAYYYVRSTGKTYRLDFYFLEDFKTWKDLEFLDGEVPFVGY